MDDLPPLMFRDRHILGVHCQNCSIDLDETRPKKENAAKTMATISAIIVDLGYGPESTKSHGWYVEDEAENEVESPTDYQEKPLPALPYSPRDFCGSGTCMEQVVFSHDGRRGHFCKQHTCAASDIGCVTDIYSPTFPRQWSHYCQTHTCVYYGCSSRVFRSAMDLCEAHMFGKKTKKSKKTRNSAIGGGYFERTNRDEEKVLRCSAIEREKSKRH
ncbi:hypothetical protein B0J13DRAFT_522345 [Dactylonectria estremocensis]|uniref:Uncharacterized protein n=1 Tax=Dactylonectria estremocensis TaxID=1079267 RepID=A0A9P9F3L3_9HYPO|nr:hypothetical protein B0J13DRAFT_522345 [Dactylonectria estremocensis]